jgi:glycerol kinase
VVRATLESLAFQSRDLVERWRETRTPACAHFKVDGGAVANDWLMQYQADLLGVPVRRPRVIETTALGAGCSRDWARHLALAARARRARALDREFKPKQTPVARRRVGAGWRSAVETLLGAGSR